MIFHPTILALCAGSILILFMVLYAAPFAVQILRSWDLQSGSEHQLKLERKTYLISTLLAYVFGFEILSFFLYIFAAEQLHNFFIGAMCAAGSLYVNGFGYPTLVVKLVVCLLAGIWLIVNFADNRAEDYPLIKKKYLFFLILVPLILLENLLQASYFLSLKPDIITSCCGTLFSSGRSDRPLWTGFLTVYPAQVLFYLTLLLASGCGLIYCLKGRGGYLFSGLSLLALIVSLVAIFAFISPYIYELPTHACPFCLLQKEYGYIGYPLYLTLLGGAITGTSVGVLLPFRKVPTLAEVLPPYLRRLALVSLILYLIFTGIVIVRTLMSGLVLAG